MARERKRLQVLRAEHDLPQHKVARRAGLNVTRYWQIENGEGRATTDSERDVIAAVFGIVPSAIAWPETHDMNTQAAS